MVGSCTRLDVLNLWADCERPAKGRYIYTRKVTD